MSPSIARTVRKSTAVGVVAALSLIPACGDEGDTPTAEPTPTTGAPGPARQTISGTITYTGAALDAHQIVIAVNRQGDNGPPAYAATLGATGAYTIENVVDGSYTVLAFIDLGDDMGAPEPNEPSGTYDPDGDGTPAVVVMADGDPATAIDIEIKDPS